MEIQLGFRLNSTQELQLLAQALMLVEDRNFREYVKIESNLPVLAEEEARLRRKVEELEGMLGSMVEYGKLTQAVQELRREEAELRQRVATLKDVIAKYEQAVKQLEEVQA